MFGFIKNIFSSKKKLDKNALTSGTVEQRMQLAQDTGLHPEALYYLAKDKDAGVRRAVAMNKSTPVHASALLAQDKSEDVRIALAARLVELLPGLSTDDHSQLYAYAVQALGVLAQDEVLKIRQALATSLKDHAKAPPKVVGQLARDVEREVSEPILRFCVALSDEDLLEILADHPAAWAVSAIAGRPTVSKPVSAAVINTGDMPAGGVLLKNTGAQISDETLLVIIERARDCPDWHETIAIRKELSLELARKLAGFVNNTVLGVLEKRSDFDAATRREIAEIVTRRMDYKQNGQETAEAKVARYMQAGKLTPGLITDALAWQDHRFVMLALVALSNIHPIVVEKMLRSGSAKPIVALCWKAKLPMRVAIELQRSYARLSPKEMMYAKGGTDYPMTAPEVKWQLEFYGIDLKQEN
jgi:uncharacterized protein (DUF2336 family)